MDHKSFDVTIFLFALSPYNSLLSVQPRYTVYLYNYSFGAFLTPFSLLPPLSVLNKFEHYLDSILFLFYFWPNVVKYGWNTKY